VPQLYVALSRFSRERVAYTCIEFHSSDGLRTSFNPGHVGHARLLRLRRKLNCGPMIYCPVKLSFGIQSNPNNYDGENDATQRGCL